MVDKYAENGYIEKGYIEGDFNPSEFPSLNGSHLSHVDGKEVLVDGYEGKFLVLSSFFFKSNATDYTIMYILKDINDKVSMVPSAFVYLEEPENNDDNENDSEEKNNVDNDGGQ